jgi:hypothetical protein
LRNPRVFKFPASYCTAQLRICRKSPPMCTKLIAFAIRQCLCQYITSPFSKSGLSTSPSLYTRLPPASRSGHRCGHLLSCEEVGAIDRSRNGSGICCD